MLVQLQIVGCRADQILCTTQLGQSAQQDLPKAVNVFDLTKERLDHALASGIRAVTSAAPLVAETRAARDMGRRGGACPCRQSRNLTRDAANDPLPLHNCYEV